jgi:hypothetical protein
MLKLLRSIERAIGGRVAPVATDAELPGLRPILVAGTVAVFSKRRRSSAIVAASIAANVVRYHTGMDSIETSRWMIEFSATVEMVANDSANAISSNTVMEFISLHSR